MGDKSAPPRTPLSASSNDPRPPLRAVPYGRVGLVEDLGQAFGQVLIQSPSRAPRVKCSRRIHIHTNGVYTVLVFNTIPFFCTFLCILLFSVSSTSIALVNNFNGILRTTGSDLRFWNTEVCFVSKSLFQTKSNSIRNEAFLDPSLLSPLRPPVLFLTTS